MNFEVETALLRDDFRQDNPNLRVDSHRKNFCIIKGSWFKPLLYSIQLKQKNDYIFNMKKQRFCFDHQGLTDFLRLDVYCSVCKATGKIFLKNFEPLSLTTKFDFKIEDHDEDIHTKKKECGNIIRGEERGLLAQSILGSSGKGSVKMYRENLASNNAPFLPTTSVLKKILTEKKHENIPGNNWIESIMCQAKLAENMWTDGYVRELKLHDYFAMTLHTNKQLMALASIKEDRRITYFDGSGKYLIAKLIVRLTFYLFANFRF